MISIPGKYYDGKTSRAVDAVFMTNSDGRARVEEKKGGNTLVLADLNQIKISPRLANTPRYFYFPGGVKFETLENTAVDSLLAQFKGRSWLDGVHLLESRKRYVLTALAFLIFFIWGGVKFAVPAVSETIAFRLPFSVLKLAGDQTLNILDRAILKPSQIENSRQKDLLNHFQDIIDTHPNLDLQIYFRKGGSIGPNAFALPSGIIIFTDEMVMAAEHDDELLAVLAHETGHIVHRHGTRRVIQDSLLGFALLAMTGDTAGSSELFLGLPVLLTEMAYSREFEEEADQYALGWLRQEGIPTAHFARLMERIEQKTEKLFKDSKRWSGYLSTHPATKERIKPFLEG